MTAQDILNLLDQIAARMSGPAQHVWELAVRQQFIEGVTTLLLVIVLLAVSIPLTIIGCRALRREMKRPPCTRDHDHEYDRTEPLYPSWITAIYTFTAACVLLVAIGFACYNGVRIATNLINPEWAALQSIAALLPTKP